MKIHFTDAARTESLEAFDDDKDRSGQAVRRFLECLKRLQTGSRVIPRLASLSPPALAVT